MIHNSQNPKYRTPFGAVEKGVSIHVFIEASGYENGFLNVLDFNDNHHVYEMEKTEEGFKYSLNTEAFNGALKYYFELKNEEGICYYGNNQEALGGEGMEYNEYPVPFQITLYDDFKTPDWFKEGVMYHIFIDRFFNGNLRGEIKNKKKNSFIYGDWYDTPMYVKNEKGEIIKYDFFGGNINGIIKKLPYLKSLGATVLYLSPVFESTSNHKYDTGDYKTLDSMFGDEEEFKKLCQKAKKLKMKVILDIALSHTGDDSIYFNKYGNYDSVGAYESPDSKYHSWYDFKEYPNEYSSWWGIKSMPNVNELDRGFMDYIINDEDSVIDKWMNMGVSGFRLDVADELPDEFIKAFRKKMKKINEDSILIGEVWEDASTKISYGKKREYVFGNELDSVMNYPFREIVINYLNYHIDSRVFNSRTMMLKENYPKEIFLCLMNMLGTHDTKRILSVFGDDTEKLKQAIVIQMTYPGIPDIYYGDEAGLKGDMDPDNRKCYPWDRENMDILDFYKKASSLRKLEIFTKGDFIPVESKSPHVLCYKRKYNEEEAVIIINRAFEDIEEILPISSGEYYDFFTTKKVNIDKNKNSVIPKRAYRVFIKKN